MTRKLIASLVALTAFCIRPVLICAADARPNVLLIILDDLNDFTGCLGGEWTNVAAHEESRPVKSRLSKWLPADDVPAVAPNAFPNKLPAIPQSRDSADGR